MDTYHYRCIKLFTFSLPLLCLVSWSWGAASTATPFLPPPSSSALLAAEALRIRGYSLFASVIVSISATANFSGTLLAPPDFAFSFATAKFSTNPRPPPRPTISLLQYHTLKPPLVLTWPDLSSRDDGDELPTLLNNCLYLLKNSHGGEVSVSPSPFRNPTLAVKIRQPDLYVDEHLTVHGIDGVLDPTFATKCSTVDVDPTFDSAGSRLVNRAFLDRAMRVLRRKGYNVVAAAMAVRRSDLLPLTAVTVFAVSDENLFLKPGGFRYDFRHHVVPSRYRIADLVESMAGGMEVDSLAPSKGVVFDSVDGAVSVNGVAVDLTEVYRNRWIVVLSIMTSLDDAVNSPITGAISDNSTPSPSPFSGVSAPDNSPRIPSPAPLFYGETINNIPSTAPANSVATPSPDPDLDGDIDGDAPSIAGTTTGSPSPAPIERNSEISPAPADTIDYDGDTHCDFIAVGIEGGDLLCPVSTARRQVRETAEILSPARHVEGSKPLDADAPVADDLTQSDEVKIAEHVDIADDVFFYI